MKRSKIKLIFEFGLWIGGIWILWCIFDDKDFLVSSIKSYLPNAEASMLVAMLWGDTSGISKVFYSQMLATGLIHILVVSGSNLMIVVKGIIEALAQWTGRQRSIILGLIIGFMYVNLVGWQIPATRAVVMVTVMYWGQLLGRKVNMFRMVVLVMLIMVLADWRVLTSTSFWMSFLAFIAVAQGQNDGVIKTTLRVNLYLFPILAWKFGYVSLVAPVSNLLTLFLVETITVLGFVGVFIKPVLWLLYPLLVYIQKVVWVLSIPSFTRLGISFNWWMMMGSYFIGLGYILRKNHV